MRSDQIPADLSVAEQKAGWGLLFEHYGEVPIPAREAWKIAAMYLRAEAQLSALKQSLEETETYAKQLGSDLLNRGRRAAATEEELARTRESHRQCVEALARAERKLRAYVGVCKGDKELTNTILPMCDAALETAAKLEGR